MIANIDSIVPATPIDKEIEVFKESVFIIEIDLEGNIVYVNRRYLSLLGFSEEELMGGVPLSCNLASRYAKRCFKSNVEDHNKEKNMERIS